MPQTKLLSFKSFPFLRLLLFLIAGILIQWYYKPGLQTIISLAAIFSVLLTAFTFFNQSKKFALRWARGLLILLLFTCLGMVLTWRQNIENSPAWFGKIYRPGNTVLLILDEPPEEKSKSFKALATIEAVNANDRNWRITKGKVLVYFKKDSAVQSLHYGSQIFLSKPLQEIQNSGNPAALDYKRYCLFQGITHQVFLSQNDYAVTGDRINPFRQFLFSTRNAALHTLQQNIHSPKELGIAEALLIGYRNDLDKDLVQAYSNTGVVHIIAISGLHIGVIYTLLLAMFSVLKASPVKKWLQPAFILLVIWMFTLLAGAAPSVSRAAVMFSCILLGKFLERNGNIYNTLSASAFILLAWDPFYLWDVGFQLSYTAVLSIVIFFNPIYKLLFLRNKSLRWVWKLSAVTISAQIFTLPLIIYHFHQFPVLFMLTNFVAVPLSTLILFGELLLFCIAWWPAAASFLGSIIQGIIAWMNHFIEHIDKLPFAVWDGLHVLTWQLPLLYACITAFSVWLFNKKAPALITALSLLTVFFILFDVNNIYHKQQQNLIVYNVPRHNAMDFIAGRSCLFAGDSAVISDNFLRNFNIKPARIKTRVYQHTNTILPGINNFILQFNSKKILVLDQPLNIPGKVIGQLPVDIVILCGDVSVSIGQLSEVFELKMVVATSNNKSSKCLQWKKDCEQLHLRFHSVMSEGAFTAKM